MTNFAIGYYNYFDTATYSGGSWLAGNPLTNLKIARQGLAARSTNVLAASTKIEVDLLNSTTVIRVLGIMKHNITKTGTVRIRAGTTPGGSDLFDSGFIEIWPRIYSYEDLDFEDLNFWTGQISDAEAESFPIKAIADLGANILARYWGFEFLDTTNPDGYLDIYRLWGGPLWVMRYNPDYGDIAVQWESRDAGQETLGGGRFSQRRKPKRVLSFKLPNLTDGEALGRALDLQRVAGSEGEVLILPDITDGRKHRLNVHGRLRRWDPVRQMLLNVHETGYEAEEFIL